MPRTVNLIRKSHGHIGLHTHDDKQPLIPDQVYELNVEIWPMCIVLPAGFRIAVNITGKDFERPGADSNPPFRSRGSGPWLHDDRYDRPADIFGGHTTLHTGPKREAFLLLPIVPTDRSGVQVLATHNGKNWDIAG